MGMNLKNYRCLAQVVQTITTTTTTTEKLLKLQTICHHHIRQNTIIFKHRSITVLQTLNHVLD